MNFVKFFDVMLASSLMNEDIEVRWTFFVLNLMAASSNPPGTVVATPEAIKRRAVLPPSSDINAILARLESPDPSSTTPDEDGRRVAREGNNVWRIINHQKYRKLVVETPQAASNRARQERFRSKNKQNVTERYVTGDNVTECDVTPGDVTGRDVTNHNVTKSLSSLANDIVIDIVRDIDTTGIRSNNPSYKTTTYRDTKSLSREIGPQERAREGDATAKLGDSEGGELILDAGGTTKKRKPSESEIRNVVAEYNAVACELNLPLAEYVTKKRELAIGARIREFGTDGVMRVVNAPRTSRFLRGETGRPGWRGANLTWLMGPENFVKALEGQYEDGRGSSPAAPKGGAQRKYKHFEASPEAGPDSPQEEPSAGPHAEGS
jgi:hypothetical protein